MVTTVVVLTSLRGPLERQVDNQLGLAGGVLARIPQTLLETLTKTPATEPELPVRDASDLIDDLYIGYLDRGGAVTVGPGRVRAAPDTPGPELPRLDAAAARAHGSRPFEVPGRRDSAPWRVIALPRQNGGSVVVAASLEQVDATVAGVRNICLLVGSGVLALLAVAGWFWVRAGLRPLRRVEHTTAAIAGGDLSERVPELAPPGTEIGRLSTALNGMLTQIETAVAARTASEERMRRFVADASHELRTPLAGIGGFAELYRMGALTDPDEVHRTMDRIERESARLGRLVDDLLLLTKTDEHGGALELRRTPMDLRSLAADALHDLRALDPDRPVELTGPGGGSPGAAPVSGDEARLRQVVSNLVGNAVEHTPAGSPIRIGIGTTGEHAILEVSDGGPGLTEDQARLVFERFYRADSSRSRQQDTGRISGAGLGLSIVRSLITAHGGTVEVESTPGEGATFRVVLPRESF
ncbi:MAG: HAMP domain-containing protein [Pseudonocardiaceae bacterium]|nr:HAMP domain-containing protein [Pseudonocardiaceae bacterium]